MAGKIHIPNDWDGKSWSCFQIQWPNSAHFRAILAGLLHSLEQGRTWDENTGNVKEIQAIGRDIFDKNYRPANCRKSGDFGSLSDWIISGFGGDCGDCGDCDDCEGDMSGCCITDLKIEGGILYMYRCGKWEPVEGDLRKSDLPVDGKDSDITTEPNDPSDPVQTESFQCAKASAYVNALYDVGQSVCVHALDLDFWNAVKKVETDSGIDLNNDRLSWCIWQVRANEALSIDICEVWTRKSRAELICQLSPRLDGTTSNMTDGDWERVKSIRTMLGSDIIEEQFVTGIIESIGRGDFDNRGRLASLDPNFDCTCPEPEPSDDIPAGVNYTWSKVFDFRAGDYGFVGYGNGGAVYEQGVGWTYSDTSFNSARLPKITRSVPGAFSPTKLTYVRVVIKGWPTSPVIGGDGYQMFRYEDQLIAGSEYIGRQDIVGVWSNPGGKSSSVPIYINGSDLYWYADANPGYKTIVEKIVMAGIDDNFWTLVNPDGSIG